MDLKLLILIIISSITLNYGLIQEISLPSDYQACYDEFAKKTDLTQSIGHLIYWHCKEACSWKLDKSNNGTSPGGDWFLNLLKELDVDEKCRPQDLKPRIRQEVRRLTRGQWNRLVKAIQALKQIRYRDTNRYDFLATFHTGAYVPIAHFGANFMPWHRLYIILYEKALRQIEPSISVPYFDVTIDVEMDNPADSIVWTEHFFGNADGVVTTGPFKNWSTPEGTLFRNIGERGGYFTKPFLEFLLTRTRIGEIQRPQALPEYDFEFVHGGPHVFVGGILSNIQRAAYDPVFYFYHCFIDYVYQQFREGSERAGVDIENDWPENYGTELHEPGRESGFGKVPSTQGRSKYYTNCVFRYEKTPNCSIENPSCGSDYMRCDTNTSRCVSLSPHEYANGTCSRGEYGFLNSFCINDVCDMKQWVYFPVEVIQFRPPGRLVGKPMRVNNKHFEHDMDIYQAKGRDLCVPPDAYTLATYTKCRSLNSYDDVTVETVGLDYLGVYQEVALPDNRLPISKSKIYMAAKRPKNKGSKVIISAADKCGCVCKIYCRCKGSNRFKLCSGALKITNQEPKSYRNSVEQMVRRSWRFDNYPREVDTDVSIKVFCDYKHDWIWNNSSSPLSSQEVALNTSSQWEAAVRIAKKINV